MSKIWSKEEIEFLKENYMNMTDLEFSVRFNKSTTQVKDKRASEKLGRRKVNRKIDWHSLEKDYENEKNIKLLAKKYNIKNTSSIRDHLVKNGLYSYTINKWDEKEIKYLKENINVKSTVEISQNLKRSVASVAKKIDDLKLNNDNIIYFYPNFIPMNEKEEFLQDVIIKEIKLNNLIDPMSMRNIIPEIDIYHHCRSVYDMGYEAFLKTFYNIDFTKYLHDNAIQIYSSYINKGITNVPKAFWTIENIIKVGRYLFRDYDEQNFYEKYNNALLVEFGLDSVVYLNNISIFDFAKLLFPKYLNYPFLFKNSYCPNGYWDNPDNRFLAIDYMVENLLNNNKISSIEEVTKFTIRNFKDYNLGGLLDKRFMYDLISEYLLRKTGKQYKECELHTVTNGHWEDVENVKTAVRWMLEEKEQWDGLDIEWVKHNYGFELFKKHGLGGMLASFNPTMSICDIFKVVYPHIDIFHWEFNSTPHYFWTKKEHSNLALKQLIEYRLKLPITDIPKYFSKTYFQFNYSKFMTPLIKLYDGNIFNWINSIYPDIFTCRDFGYIECLDGTIVKSLTEQMIHNYLISKYNNVKYISNQKENEGVYIDTKYIPDWIIDDNIIIEYLGLYKDKITDIEKYDKYRLKTKKKIKIAHKSELTFIFIYESDLKNNLEGLKKKFEVLKNN